MSGICGIVNFDGEPANLKLLQKMTLTSARRGPNGIRYWTKDNVGFSYLALHTTPESVKDRQPLVTANTELVLTADARIDNRAELIRIFTTNDCLVSQSASDAELILNAYHLWGSRCPEYLIGDFAFAVWDASKKRLFAARDRAGCRSFYYHHASRCFYFATEASQLLANQSISSQLDEEMIAHDLAIPGAGGRHDSYYKAIKKLGPAERLVVSDSQARCEPYWSLQPEKKIRYSKNEEYVEHFAAIFRDAVRCRLRSTRPVGVFLSGGLDSASIAGMAANELERDQSSLAPGISAVNWTFSSTPEANEYQFSCALANRYGFNYEEVDMENYWPLYDYPQHGCHRDEPFSSHMYSFHKGSIERLPMDARPNVWMTGYPGDLLVGGFNPFYYNRLMRSLDGVRLWRSLKQDRQNYGVSWKMILFDAFVSPMYLQPWRQRLGRLRRDGKPALPSWITTGLIEQTGLYEWVKAQPLLRPVDAYLQPMAKLDPATEWRYRLAAFHRQTRMRIWYDRMGSALNTEIWNPWDDMRLQEFVLAVPQEQIVAGLNHKIILRKAMRGLLPDSVRERRGLRTGPGLYISEGLRKHAHPVFATILAHPGMKNQEFIDMHQLQASIIDFQRGKRGWDFSIWIAVSLAIWLQAYVL